MKLLKMIRQYQAREAGQRKFHPRLYENQATPGERTAAVSSLLLLVVVPALIMAWRESRRS